MSNSIIPKSKTDLVPEPTTDFSDLDQKKIQLFIEEGLPGLYAVNEEQVSRMLELYLSGKPYVQISRILKLDRSLIMYLSSRYNWFNARKEYHHELESTIRNRIVAEKVDNQDFVLKLTHFFKKKLGKQIDNYLATDNEAYANAVDSKDIAQAIKTIETLERISSDAAVGKPVAPAVGLNLGDGVTVSKNEDGTVDITPKQKTVAEMVKQFADAQREAEKNKK